jgi:hypothetical protein
MLMEFELREESIHKEGVITEVREKCFVRLIKFQVKKEFHDMEIEERRCLRKWNNAVHSIVRTK